MVPTDKLAQLARLADSRGWRVALVGDPLQFSAVGRSGMFAHLVEASGAIELDGNPRLPRSGTERDVAPRLKATTQTADRPLINRRIRAAAESRLSPLRQRRGPERGDPKRRLTAPRCGSPVIRRIEDAEDSSAAVGAPLAEQRGDSVPSLKRVTLAVPSTITLRCSSEGRASSKGSTLSQSYPTRMATCS